MILALICKLVFIFITVSGIIGAASVTNFALNLVRGVSVATIQNESEARGEWLRSGGFEFDRDEPSRYWAFMNHVLLIKNLFNQRGKAGFFFRTLQRNAQATMPGMLMEFVADERIFQDPINFTQWYYVPMGEYEILSSRPISLYAACAITAMCSEACKIGNGGNFGNCFGMHEASQMEWLKKEWVALSPDLASSPDWDIEILIFENNFSLEARAVGCFGNYHSTVKKSRILPIDHRWNNHVQVENMPSSRRAPIKDENDTGSVVGNNGSCLVVDFDGGSL